MTANSDRYLLACAISIAGDMFGSTDRSTPQEKEAVIRYQEQRLNILLATKITALLKSHNAVPSHVKLSGIIQDTMSALNWRFMMPNKWVVLGGLEPLSRISKREILRAYSNEEHRLNMVLNSPNFIYALAHRVNSSSMAKEALRLDPSIKNRSR